MESKRSQSDNSKLEEDWRKVKTLGEGTFGVVTLWKSFPGGNFVAVKKFRVPFQYTVESEKLKTRCKDEVERMIAIDHPNIVGTIKPSKELLAKLSQKLVMRSSSMDTYDPSTGFHDPEFPLLCMEYCSGGDLGRLLKRPENLSGLPEKEILAVLSNISEAIVYLHNQSIGKGRYIIHRDIKPDNIVIQWDSKLKRYIYKLSDLGLAKDVSSDGSQCSTFLGTPEYIAPEIFQRKKYDKTVDFWSFGLIVYEISCGSRPLPTDSLDRYALVKAEIKDLVTEIPLKTHLSELFRKCLSNWLPTMLQYYPGNRGKYKIQVGDKEVTTCSLAWLQNLLSATFLHVYTSTKGRLVFRVRSNTAISDVQQWVSKNTGLRLEDQLLLTMDGSEVSSVDMAINYALNKPRLYLVARIGEEISTKIILPKILSGFLIDNANSPMTSDTSHLKRLWNMAIFHIQCQLERTEDLLKIQESLKNWKNAKSSGRMTKTEAENMQEWYMKFCDLRSRFNALISMQEKLDEINFNFVGELESPQYVLNIKTSAQELHSRIEMYFREYFKHSCDDGSPKTEDTNCLVLKDFYNRLLREYDLWHTISRKGSYTSKNWDEVRKIISSFLTTQQSILISLDFNIKLLRQSATTFEERDVKIQDWLLTLKGYEDKVIESGLKKQKMILEFSFPPSSPNLVTENPMVMDVRPSSPESTGCYGRSRAVSPLKYLSSLLPVPETRQTRSSISTSEMSTSTSTLSPNTLPVESSDENDNVWVVLEKE